MQAPRLRLITRSPRAVRAAALLLVVLVAAVAIAGSPARPKPARAGEVQAPVDIGTSFSPARAEALGLDYRQAFDRLLAMHFAVIRISAYWDEVDAGGWSRVDWLMAEAARHDQRVVLSVGMKGIGWPEFYIPRQYQPAGLADGGDVGHDPATVKAALAFVEEAVQRYRGNRALYAWQVENEPFNHAGPHRWWIDRQTVSKEAAVVRRLDVRPVVVNAFGRFNIMVDRGAGHSGLNLGSLLGFDADSAEKDSLGVLGPGDILGLDVYTAIGYKFLGQERLTRASSDWALQAGKWRTTAHGQGKRAWVTEAQAEPWEPGSPGVAHPRSTSPEEMSRLFQGLKGEGYGTVLLWGSEYWLWRADQGDDTWMNAVHRMLLAETAASVGTGGPPLT
jgi:hypothetical protein